MNKAKLILKKENDQHIVDALKRTHTERFFFLMKLIKIKKMLQSAKIINNK
jgi:hypothetical protein